MMYDIFTCVYMDMYTYMYIYNHIYIYNITQPIIATNYYCRLYRRLYYTIYYNQLYYMFTTIAGDHPPQRRPHLDGTAGTGGHGTGGHGFGTGHGGGVDRAPRGVLHGS
jgi:hypothetical protein